MVISPKLHQKLLSSSHLGLACPCDMGVSVIFLPSLLWKTLQLHEQSAMLGNAVILLNTAILIIKDGDIVGG